jgi:hypothetical protein
LRKTQEVLDRLREQHKDSDRRFADISNDKSAASRKRKHASLTEGGMTEDKENRNKGKDISMKEIDDAGKHFAIQFHLFIDVKALRRVIITKKYTPEKRFREESDMVQQGFIHDILGLLPKSLAKKCRKQKQVDEWILRRVSVLLVLAYSHLA